MEEIQVFDLFSVAQENLVGVEGLGHWDLDPSVAIESHLFLASTGLSSTEEVNQDVLSLQRIRWQYPRATQVLP